VDFRERFASNLVRCRKRAGFSQETLADRASIHRTEIGLFEGGKRTPRIDTLVKVAGGLGVPPHELLEGVTWKPGNGGDAGGFEFS
jgi:transcriptional regulator with XRE-family HTH domain